MQIEDEWVKGKSVAIKMQSMLPSAIVFNCSIVAKNEHAKVEWLDALLAARSEFVDE